ncbi:hypothetical protein AOQ84DRAFT_201547 [Glonium stellatum]|uniref:Uncharacterized protein n=1 Tax=Glonium stellatum TaxID=574774 RepID=A0A8E2F6Z3_9PEZI|nr:hypothetical protein AOQ84DRAFT_201547 [Glonium stellatum]
MQQEELARLFSANLTLSPSPSPTPPIPRDLKVEQPQQQKQDQSPPKQPQTQPITYISQHYTHSSHIAPKPQPAPASTSTSTSTPIPAAELEGIFLRNSIDPTLLFPSQITLFQNADNDQRLRLLELWRISPPTTTAAAHAHARELYDWPPTSLQQEETMAKLRYERMLQQQEQEKAEALRLVAAEIHSHNQGMDESMDHESAAAAAVRAAELSASVSVPVPVPEPAPEDARLNAEPYMMSGYEALAKREYDEQEWRLQESTRYNQAIDPVYKATTNLWGKTGLQDMENQYGAFAQMREYGIAAPQHSFVGYGDDDMVM